jgi:hypothetical protein
MRGLTLDGALSFLIFAAGCSSSTVATSQDAGYPPAPDAGGPDTATPLDGSACDDGGAPSWQPEPASVDTAIAAAGHPLLGIDGSGNAIAVWEESDPTGSVWTVWASEKPAGGAWSTPQRIDGAGSGGLVTEPFPSLAVSASGAAVVVFQRQYPGEAGPPASNVWHVEYAAGTGWDQAAQFFAPVVGNQVVGNENAQVAIDSKGNATAIWAQDMGDSAENADFGPQIYASRLEVGQAWSTSSRLSSYAVNGFTGTPHVAVDDAGDAVAAWSTNPANSPIRVMGAHFGGTPAAWSTAGFIDQCTSCPSNIGILPRLAMDASGNGVAVWAQGQTGASIAVYAARYTTSSGSWANAQQLDAGLNTQLNASAPRLVVDRAGQATAVWVNVSNDASHPNTIIADRFTGGAWQGAAPIDTTKPGGNGRPAIAVDDAGDVMVVWDDQETLWATELPAGAAAFQPEIQLDPKDTSAGFAAVAFAPGCPLALTAYVNGTGADGGNATGVFARTFE